MPRLLSLLASVLLTSAASAQAAAPARTPSVPWAVATANPLATDAGAAVLANGGDAIDAAVAVQAVLGLVEPQSSGLGGGAFLLYFDAQDDTLTAYDGREIAPASARPDMFLTAEGQPMNFYDAVTSGRSVGVPGVVAMLHLAHREHGELPWRKLFTAADRLARDGFPVSARLNELLTRTTRLTDNAAARALYYDAQGNAVAAGTRLRNPAYAETLQLIAKGGANAFYHGPIADQIIAAVNAKAGAGTMTKADFDAYKPLKREVICGGFLAYEVCSMTPPSSGGVTVLQILGLYERAGAETEPTPRAWLDYLEASRLAYADRDIYLADPASMTLGGVAAEDLVRGLVTDAYLDLRATLIGEAPAESVEAGDPLPVPLRELRAKDQSPGLPGTSHFSIRDRAGNIVSMTTTVEFAFGSHLMAGGMILNNQLTDFSFVPARNGVTVANAVEAGKRPRSSMTPVIVLDADGQPVLAIGSPGGPAIIGYVAKTLIAHLAWGMPLQDAVSLPNVVVPRGQVIVEDTATPAMLGAIEAAGYTPRRQALTSGLYGFRVDGDEIEPGVDPRREGSFRTGN